MEQNESSKSSLFAKMNLPPPQHSPQTSSSVSKLSLPPPQHSAPTDSTSQFNWGAAPRLQPPPLQPQHFSAHEPIAMPPMMMMIPSNLATPAPNPVTMQSPDVSDDFYSQLPTQFGATHNKKRDNYNSNNQSQSQPHKQFGHQNSNPRGHKRGRGGNSHQSFNQNNTHHYNQRPQYQGNHGGNQHNSNRTLFKDSFLLDPWEKLKTAIPLSHLPVANADEIHLSDESEKDPDEPASLVPSSDFSRDVGDTDFPTGPTL